jgi:hypothetical protein
MQSIAMALKAEKESQPEQLAFAWSFFNSLKERCDKVGVGSHYLFHRTRLPLG